MHVIISSGSAETLTSLFSPAPRPPPTPLAFRGAVGVCKPLCEQYRTWYIRYRAKREHLKTFQGLSPEEWLNLRPASGLDCLIRADFTRQRHIPLLAGVCVLCKRGRACSKGLSSTAVEQEGHTLIDFQRLSPFKKLKSRPKSGLDWIWCSGFTRQR